MVHPAGPHLWGSLVIRGMAAGRVVDPQLARYTAVWDLRRPRSLAADSLLARRRMGGRADDGTTA